MLDYQYTYDKTGNIEQKATLEKTYAYGELQRLTETKSEDETEGWEYDPNGNRTSDNLNPGSWDYDVNDRLTESPAVTYTYDDAGNTTSKTEDGITTTYLYNAEGRLSRIEDATGTAIAEYAYDPLGRRYKKVTPGETLYFYYTDEGLAGEFDGTGGAVRQYVYVPDSIKRGQSKFSDSTITSEFIMSDDEFRGFWDSKSRWFKIHSVLWMIFFLCLFGTIIFYTVRYLINLI